MEMLGSAGIRRDDAPGVLLQSGSSTSTAAS